MKDNRDQQSATGAGANGAASFPGGESHRSAQGDAGWRYDDHLGASLALAFGGGLVVGMLLGPREPTKAARSAGTPLKARLLKPLSAVDQDGRLTRQVGETWNHILDALVAVGTAKAVDMVSSVVPGFRDHYPDGPRRPAQGRPSEW